MKRFNFWLSLIAIGIIFRFEQCYINGNRITGQNQCDLTVIYEGDDVPGTYQVTHMSVILSSTAVISQYNPGLATLIRADATARGFTIPAGNVFQQQWSNF